MKLAHMIIAIFGLMLFAAGCGQVESELFVGIKSKPVVAASSPKAAFQSRIMPVQNLLNGPTISNWIPASVQPSNLYVVLSGNGSCPKGYPSRVAPGLQENELFMAFNQWVLAGGIITASDRVIYACYEWQSPQMQFYDLGAERRMMPLLETQIPELVVGRMPGFNKIFIVGHSHAGWLAMKLASSPMLLSYSSVPIVLATIDPVSRVTCQRLREQGCREAPREFTPVELQNLNVRTRWLNLFHQPAIILGSGPIGAAHQNVRVNANHVAMQTDASVWQTVRQFFLSYR